MTGLRTEIGTIAALTESKRDLGTPLERRVESFSRHLVFLSLALFARIYFLGCWRGIPFAELVMIAISQVVSVVPEGLPVALTVALAVGVERMAAKKAIVRKLPAVETVGSVTIIFILFVALIAGFPPPFAAVQILWNNLVTEGVIVVNLIKDPAEGNGMKRNPVSPTEPLVTRFMLERMFVLAPTLAAVTLGWLFYRLQSGVPLDVARTETFSLLAVCEWFNVLNCRSVTRSALTLDIFKNPWLIGGILVAIILQTLVVFWRPLGSLFHAVSVDFAMVPILFLLGSVILWVEETRKLFHRRHLAGKKL